MGSKPAQVHSDFQGWLNYTVRLCLKTNKSRSNLGWLWVLVLSPLQLSLLGISFEKQHSLDTPVHYSLPCMMKKRTCLDEDAVVLFTSQHLAATLGASELATPAVTKSPPQTRPEDPESRVSFSKTTTSCASKGN